MREKRLHVLLLPGNTSRCTCTNSLCRMGTLVSGPVCFGVWPHISAVDFICVPSSRPLLWYPGRGCSSKTNKKALLWSVAGYTVKGSFGTDGSLAVKLSHLPSAGGEVCANTGTCMRGSGQGCLLCRVLQHARKEGYEG